MYSISPFKEFMSNPFSDLMNMPKVFNEQFIETNRITAYKNDNSITIFMEIPGIAKEFVKVTTEDSKVVIDITEDENAVFKYKAMHEEFTVSKHYDTNNVSAKIENGILEINLEKKEEAKPRVIEIK